MARIEVKAVPLREAFGTMSADLVMLQAEFEKAFMDIASQSINEFKKRIPQHLPGGGNAVNMFSSAIESSGVNSTLTVFNTALYEPVIAGGTERQNVPPIKQARLGGLSLLDWVKAVGLKPNFVGRANDDDTQASQIAHAIAFRIGHRTPAIIARPYHLDAWSGGLGQFVTNALTEVMQGQGTVDIVFRA